jgi:hypothetical protein
MRNDSSITWVTTFMLACAAACQAPAAEPLGATTNELTNACPGAASPDGTTVPPAASITDAHGDVWTIVNQQVAKNAVVDPVTGWVVQLLYLKGTLWQENSGHDWYGWTGTGWTAASPDPRTVSAPSASGHVPAGIQNLQLAWTNPGTIDALYDQMARDLPALPWVRADFQDDDPTVASNFVEEVKKAHAHGMKVLAMTSPTAGDVGGGSFPYPLSRLDATQFANRIRTYMNALEAAGESVEAWEIGNELDTNGFNADDPQDVALFQQAYGRMIQTAVRAIKDPAYASAFPSTKIVTVGFANELDFNPGGHQPNPPAALAGLRNLGGVDYLAGVDGYGMHVYPTPDTVASHTQRIFQQYQDAGLTDRPIWITEWGFHRAQFPYQGHPRSWADQQWLAFVQGYAGLRVAATFLFDYRADAGENYDYDIYDGSTLRQDEADVLTGWNR